MNTIYTFLTVFALQYTLLRIQTNTVPYATKNLLPYHYQQNREGDLLFYNNEHHCLAQSKIVNLTLTM